MQSLRQNHVFESIRRRNDDKKIPTTFIQIFSEIFSSSFCQKYHKCRRTIILGTPKHEWVNTTMQPPEKITTSSDTGFDRVGHVN